MKRALSRVAPAPVDVVLFVGIALVGAGVAMVYVPAALVTIGGLLIAGALRVEGVGR
jgi:hypothetical protein